MKKYIALLLALLLVFCGLAGCGTSGSGEDTVLSVNGCDISWDTFMYFLGYAATTLQSYYQNDTGSGVDWDGVCMYDKSISNAQWCVNEALYMSAQCAVVMSKAKELNASPTDEQLADIDEAIEGYKENFSESDDPDAAFAEALKAQNFTLESFKTINGMNIALSNVFAALYGENGEKLDSERFDKYVQENGFMSSAHILFKNTKTNDDGEEEDLSDSEVAEQKAKAEEVAKELQGISDEKERSERFFELMNELSEDPGKASFPEGYCFTEGTMVQEYTDATKALNNYEVSGVVESDYGYHVIMRVPTKPESIDASNQYGYTLGQMAASYAFDDDMKNWNISDYANFTASYKSIDFTQFFSDTGFKFTTYNDFFAVSDK